ncbi:U3 snoRNP protein [Malassezia cuniculi]|uniref:U3 small nucleolar RNA-associated protein 22 n=1 Tax=Malassezia cuniculi TaxID=948313 RepID=A0AAF0J6A3_9BASI|nr:U3 snoRNP protein [Malassezia cuniculi]
MAGALRVRKAQRTGSRKAPEPEPIEMFSDEDLEGGFEDVEGQDDVDEHDVASEADVDEADDDGDDDDKQGTQAAAASRPKHTAAHFAIPSNEEIQGLKETSDLYMNNVFKLQLDEMLKQVAAPYDRAESLEKALRRIQAIFAEIPAIPAQTLAAARATLEKRVGHRVDIHFPQPPPSDDAPLKYAFEAPSALNLVGSWPLRTAARRPGLMDVDVDVVMPSSLFQDKDAVNHRYFYKRAFYLAVLAEAIIAADASKSKRTLLHADVQYADVHGDRRRLCLVLRPKAGSDTDFSKAKAVIRIHLAHENGIFGGRLAPTRNNLRASHVLGTDAADAADEPTPVYNSAIQADSLRLAHLVFLHAKSQEVPAFAEAVQMLKTWATQRGFGTLTLDEPRGRQIVAGSESARFVLSMLLAHLLCGSDDGNAVQRRPKLSSGFSNYQLFRGVLDFIAKTGFSKPVFMKSQPQYGLQGSRLDFAPFANALVDPSGQLNLLADWPAQSVELLRHEASLTLEMLNDGADHFGSIFLTPRDLFLYRFDEVATVSLPPAAGVAGADRRHAALERLLDVAQQALGTRATAVAASYSVDACQSWTAEPPRVRSVHVGLRLDSANAFRQVDHGPAPESADAPAFRAFWGSVAEVRRFRDGRILESVVWPVSSLAQRAALPRRVLRHALTHHECIRARSSLRFVGDAMDGLTEIPSSLASSAYISDPSVQGFHLVRSTFDMLTKRLRALELPLSVIGVAPASSALRSMSTFVPGPLNIAGLGGTVPDVAAYMPVHDVVITLESSGRWPDDLAAIQSTKTAFYERLAQMLTAELDGAQARVRYDLDAGDQIRDETCVEVVLSAGFAFALRIHHERERTLLERVIKDKAEPQASRARATRALDVYNVRFDLAPRHHAALAALSHRYPALGDTVRLVKRFVRAHMLSPHVCAEALEMVCVAAFTSGERMPPATGAAGLVAVLYLLSTWDWREAPLLVPLDSAINAHHVEGAPVPASVPFPPAARAQAEQQFRLARARDPAVHHHAWYIATEEDSQGSTWTRDAPPAAVAEVIRRLATGAIEYLRGAPVLKSADVHALFAPSLGQFDFVIHIKPSVHMRYSEALAPDSSAWLRTSKKRSFRNLSEPSLKPSVYGAQVRAGLDPVAEYVELLLHLYPGTFRLFYDEHGGTAIGGQWNPVRAQGDAQFKVLLHYSSEPVEGRDRVTLNKSAVLAEIERLGHGLVARIET